MSALFIGSRIYRGSSYGTFHPLSIPRVPTVMDLCQTLGWLPADVYRTSPRAKSAALKAFHTPEHVAAVQRAEKEQSVDDKTRARHGLGTLSNPVFPEMFRRPATACGGSLLGVELLREGGIVHNPGGGTHHGMADRAAGFCYFNDPVLALKAFERQGFSRILYIDIDAHHCDGVEMAFQGSKAVRLLSIHEKARWPFTGAFEETANGAALNLPVPGGFHDAEFDWLWERVVLPFVDRWQPQAVVLQCGADAVLEDPLSRLALSNRSHVRASRDIKERAPRLLVLGGGGYNPWTVGRCWSAIWATVAGIDMPERLPAEGQDILKALCWSRKQQPEQALLETILDDPRRGSVRSEIVDLAESASARFKGIRPIT
ncbi:MAG: acetoin utilization protein AcuC [Marinovum sp.]|nr:acetoin utilization protein AcuC [Marinovum sp.]